MYNRRQLCEVFLTIRKNLQVPVRPKTKRLYANVGELIM